MQNLEIELKYQLAHENIVKTIQLCEDLGFSSEGRKYEKTSMYDNRDFIMQKSNGRIRLRISGDENSLSYKKPILDESGIKKEIEYEFTISDPQQAALMLNAMDFYEMSSYERYRTTLRDKNHEIKVTIDEFPFDVFLEIEGEEEKILEIAGNLGYPLEDNLVKPCDTLFNERRRSQGLEEKMIMSFDTYNLP